MKDAVELVLIPGAAAVLPWTVCFSAFKFLSRHWHWLYRDACERSLAGAAKAGYVQDASVWIARRRLVTMVDHADFYLSRTRGPAWLERHLLQRGVWPQAGTGAVLCTFHWGAGMWGLRHIRKSGLEGHMMVAPLVKDHFSGRGLMYRYIAARTGEIERALGHPTLDVGRSLRPALRALQNDQVVIAAIDVPADQVSSSLRIPFLGRHARVPRALLRMAVENGIPVSTFLTGIDLETGERFIEIKPVHNQGTVDDLTHAVFARLEEAIEKSPASWHFWSEAERFFDNENARIE